MGTNNSSLKNSKFFFRLGGNRTAEHSPNRYTYSNEISLPSGTRQYEIEYGVIRDAYNNIYYGGDAQRIKVTFNRDMGTSIQTYDYYEVRRGDAPIETRKIDSDFANYVDLSVDIKDTTYISVRMYYLSDDLSWNNV